MQKKKNFFFENSLAITILHFVARQLTVLSYASHIIEEPRTCIAEMKTEINKTPLVSEHRKS
jgi:hypothetical protein